MSKMDGLRAMREARYAENNARAKAAPGAKATPAKASPAKKATTKAAATKATPTPEVAGPVETTDADLCGHRAISGRTCTREKGHAAKSHRYA